MSGSLNKVHLIGNLGKDPEVRSTASGGKIVNMTLATSESWNDKASGERKIQTEWHRVVVFNERIADVAEKYLKKGAKVYVEGALQTRKWTDQSGTEKYTTEIVIGRFKGELTMLSGKADGDAPSATTQRQDTSRSAAPASRGGRAPANKDEDLDDSIPF